MLHRAPNRPAGLLTRQVPTEANPDQSVFSPRSVTMFPISGIQEAVRRVQAHQDLQLILWTVYKTARCCLSPAPCHILSPLTFSWRWVFTGYRDPLIQLQRDLSSPWGPLSYSQRHYTVSSCHRSYFWVWGDKKCPGPQAEVVSLGLYQAPCSPLSLELRSFGLIPPSSNTQQVKQLGSNKHSSSFILVPSYANLGAIRGKESVTIDILTEALLYVVSQANSWL